MPIVSTGQITIVDVNDGLDVSLSANGVVLAADTAGTVGSFSTAETTLAIREAGVDTSASWTFYISATGGGISYRDSDDAADRTGTGSVNGLLTGTTGYVKVVALSQDLSYLDITAIKGTQTVVRRFSVAKARQGATGATGATGPRGTISTSAATAGTAWSDTEANTAISAAGGGTPVQGDVVTLYNTGASFSQTRVRSSGGTWSPLTAFFGGDVIVDNTLAASKIVANSITAGQLAVGAVTADKIAANAIAVGSAAIANGAITNAMIENATITSAKIAEVSADKVSAGTMQVGAYIQSSNYASSGGTQGWRINADGTAILNNVQARGDINATSGTIVGATIATAASGQRIVLDSRGLLFLTGASSGKYGTFKYGAKKYGSGVLVYFNNADKRVPFYVSGEQNVADIHLYNRGANPTGATYEAGDMICVNGRLRIFVPALGGWKQVALEP